MDDSNTNTKLYTPEEKIKQCIEIKKQLKQLGLDVYKEEMKMLDDIIQKYVKQDEEYYGFIKLPKSKRIMEIMFKNKKKWNISLNLRFKENI